MEATETLNTFEANLSFGKKFFTFSRDETTRARTLDETESQREKTFAERERESSNTTNNG